MDGQLERRPGIARLPAYESLSLKAQAWRTPLLRAWQRLRRRLYDDVCLLIYRHDLQAIPPEESPPFARNRVEDVLAFRQIEAWYGTLQFQHDAWARLADGEWFYSHCEDERLDAWFWLVPEQTHARFGAVKQDYDFPPGSYVSYGAYVHPAARGLGLFSAGKRQLLRELAVQPGARQAYCAIRADNRASRAVSEKLGYRVEAALRYRRILFWQRRWREPVENGLWP
ncbi:MAG: GNAT family N-acetyltransferase [Gammaproteobacteria bacterium]|nr:GNAT family N-acetyltransferase [Gammaproteobacteria bacterium]